MTTSRRPTTEEALARLAMPMVEAMRTQRAVRRLHTDPVDLDLIYELLELSLKAPTSSNTQDWNYIVVTGREQKSGWPSSTCRCTGPSALRAPRGAGNDPKAQRQMAPGQWQAEHFADIPVFVVPCYQRNLKHHAVGWPQISVSSFYGSVYPGGAEPAARLPGRRARRVAADAADLDRPDRPPDPRPAAQPGAGVHHPDRLGQGQLRARRPAPIREVVHIDRYGNQPDRVISPPAARQSPSSFAGTNPCPSAGSSSGLASLSVRSRERRHRPPLLPSDAGLAP